MKGLWGVLAVIGLYFALGGQCDAACFQAATPVGVFAAGDCGSPPAALVSAPVVNPYAAVNAFNALASKVALRQRFINGTLFQPTIVLREVPRLKVVKGPFSATVSLEKRQLTLMLGGMYAGRFPIGLGRIRQATILGGCLNRLSSSRCWGMANNSEDHRRDVLVYTPANFGG